MILLVDNVGLSAPPHLSAVSRGVGGVAYVDEVQICRVA